MKRRIGFLDSGMGGISLLNEIDGMTAGKEFLYYGDLANSPYGNKGRQQVADLVAAGVEFLIAKGADVIVIACNTATSVAIDYLRNRFAIPVFGMEPALKPAAMEHPDGELAVLATSLTLNEDKYLSLKKNLNLHDNVHPYSCDGLATLIDKKDLAGAEKFLEPIVGDIIAKNINAVVLGCTHYVFMKDFIAKKGLNVFDGNQGTARHILGRKTEPGANTLELYLNTKNPEDEETAKFFLSDKLKKSI